MTIDFDTLVLGPCMDAFGEPVVWMPAVGGASVSTTGVFDAFYKEIAEAGAEVGTAITRTFLGVRASSLPSLPVENDTFFLPNRNATYIVSEADSDGIGHLRIFLRGPV
ncbi:MAG: hypothetical protein KGN77_01810 [Xanthomonadaceae bacterium]|nr:hypothetical protein [Xanthomonadaceae bacterium]